MVHKTVLFLGVIVYSFAFSLQSYEIVNPISSYGWLDQYSEDTRYNYVGDEACCPTSSTNCLAYLQNKAPQVFGTQLSGISYADWETTDSVLIELMGTTAKNGTYNYRFVYGLNEYIRKIKGYPEVQFSGQFPRDTWAPAQGYPKPKYITNGKSTINFLSQALASGSGALISIAYGNGGGHEILANGIQWDPKKKEGILFFIDPLDPSQNYTPKVPTGPTKQTKGKIKIDKSGKILLTYQQYQGRLPFNDKFDKVHATLDGILSVGGGAFVPFEDLLTNGNPHEIAAGFDQLDPTTKAMFPILSTFNTSSVEKLDLFFQQMDPSVFAGALIAEADTILQTQQVVTNNLRDYLEPCFGRNCKRGFRFWGAPIYDHIWRKNEGSHRGFHSNLNGGIGGLDYFLCDDVLIGAGGSYGRTQLHWSNAHANGHIDTWGGFIYGALLKSCFWLDASFGYFSNRIHAERSVFFSPSLSFISPFKAKYDHHNHSSAYLAHLGGHFNLACFSSCGIDTTFWPFASFDYVYAEQNKFHESDEVLALTVKRNNYQLLQPKIGLGASFFFDPICEFSPFIHATVAYTNEIRLNGRHTKGYFSGNPNSEFTVHGLYPQIGAVNPGVVIGIKSPCDTFRFHVSYEGVFGSQVASNEASLEISVAF